MDKKMIKLLIVFTLFAWLFGITSFMAMADDTSLPPPPPTDQFGGGSSGGGGSYNPPVFATYTTPLKSSDGTVIGYLNGKNFNSVLVWAEKNGTVGNASYDLTIEGELSSKPSNDCWLDIDFLNASSAAVPPGMESGLVLGVLNVTKSPSDWGYKSSPAYTLKMTVPDASVNPDDPYYIIWSDGSNYQLKKVSLSVAGNETTVKFNPSSDTGLFTVVRAPMATPTPTPTPTPEPTVTPSPTPLPGNSMWAFPIFIVLFVVGVIVGAAALYLLNIHR